MSIHSKSPCYLFKMETPLTAFQIISLNSVFSDDLDGEITAYMLNTYTGL